MYIYLIFYRLLVLVRAFIVRDSSLTHLSGGLSTHPCISILPKYTSLTYSNPNENGSDIEEEDIAHLAETKNFNDTDNDLEMMEFLRSSDKDGKLSDAKLKISRRLWKLLMGLLIYRSRYNDYNIGYEFVFDEEDENHQYIAGYPLGEILNNLLDLVDLHGKDPVLFKKYNESLQLENKHFPVSDVKEAPKLLWLLGFPTHTYIKKRKELDSIYLPAKSVTTRLRKWNLLKPLKHASLYDIHEDNTVVIERTKQVKKIINEFLKDEREYLMSQLMFSNPQELPAPSNKALPRERILKTIVSEILEKHKSSSVCPLVQRDTRFEIEGGYHYSFYHWSFEQVVQCLVLFNDMYFDHNRELLISCERSGTQFEPVTFNILRKNWRVPENDNWPKVFHGMPLGYFIDNFRNGDTDAKEHWLRRAILDHIGFNWGDGIKYLTFTWDKLELGLIWFINFRGFPIVNLTPDMEISKTTAVAKFGKPEEIQGLKLGRLVYTAIDQIQVLRQHYPNRYKFLSDMGLNVMWKEQIGLGYRPVPHSKFVNIDKRTKVSTDKKYLFDETNPHPKDMDVINVVDVVDENISDLLVHKDEKYNMPQIEGLFEEPDPGNIT
ncbi:conserved hypothetical protein [Theileria equi strain WA]|uniref:Uncharacterized protein n=1 Tax=Theileria equi strain WA TaxID=1537102 RepID=L1LCE9_THEEQ|nr:conserved hypothetical protein [Theileria equi strain WA]EKX72954.1 conserved hypothetical protein [Theileria equi strain WA]|eukprot:XP_004832406.1 conserved hypothetical protein [Theileria equi strain WA]